MLSELRVRDLGVIDDLTLVLGPGMTALTGETGAGKTLLVVALGLVLGGRADPSLVRRGATEALVEARFVDEDGPGSRGAEGEAETVLARAVPAHGRSRAWIDGRMAPVSALAEAGADLVDIHGQHDHQSLLTPGAQRRLLDQFGGSDLEPRRVAQGRLDAIERRLGELGGDERERARRLDVLEHQVGEIAAAELDDPEEEAALLAEEERLANAAAIRRSAAAAAELLSGDEAVLQAPSALDSVGRALEHLGAEVFSAWAGRLRDLVAEVADVARDLRQVSESWEDDPARLAEVQERRRQLAELRRKYGPTLLEVMAFKEAADKERQALLRASEEATALGAERREARLVLEEAERSLRSTRQLAAPRLARAVAEGLVDLAMAGARFEVEVADEGAGDAVRFLLGANRGEDVQPLARVASGGELARLMLALRLVAAGGPQTMVFDEVDAGVGGQAALALAGALRQVARGGPRAAERQRQVLVVTHLAQVAAFADRQVAVRKGELGGRTVTVAEPVQGPDRVVELARMLSGQPDSKAARTHAEDLLALARR